MIRLIVIFFLITSLSAEEMVSKKYSAKAAYYIPGVQPLDIHPAKPFEKYLLDDPFTKNFTQRLKDLTLTFPKGSSIKVILKNTELEMVNTPENHDKLRYLIQSYEIANEDAQVKTVCELVEVKDNSSLLLLSPSELTRKVLFKTEGVKKINQFEVLSPNGESARTMSNSSWLTVTPEINQETLQGRFEIQWSLAKGDKKGKISLDTEFTAGNNESRVVQVQQKDGSLKRNLYCVFTFIFINKFGQIIKPVKLKKPEAKKDGLSVRLYRISQYGRDFEKIGRIIEESLEDVEYKTPKGAYQSWRRDAQTYVFVNTEENLKIADAILKKYQAFDKQLKISVQVMEVKDDSTLKNKLPGSVTYEDLMKIPKDKRQFKFSTNSLVTSAVRIKYSDTDEPVKAEEDREDEPRVGLFFEVAAELDERENSISVDFSWENNIRLKEKIKEQLLEFRYLVNQSRRAVFQLQGNDGKVFSQYLILTVEENVQK